MLHRRFQRRVPPLYLTIRSLRRTLTRHPNVQRIMSVASTAHGWQARKDACRSYRQTQQRWNRSQTTIQGPMARRFAFSPLPASRPRGHQWCRRRPRNMIRPGSERRRHRPLETIFISGQVVVRIYCLSCELPERATFGYRCCRSFFARSQVH